MGVGKSVKNLPKGRTIKIKIQKRKRVKRVKRRKEPKVL